MPTMNRPNEIRITRIYDAAVEAVWSAWTDPVKVAQWWGPRGFTITTHSKDLRPGGHWVYTMHGPDGTDYENKTHYHEVKVLSKLVYDHGGNDDRPPLFKVTATFSRLAESCTEFDLIMELPSPEAAEETRKAIIKAGGGSTWDRLAEFLAKETKNQEIFVINRSFNAPIEQMYQMWSDPKHLAQWVPPTGFSMEYLNADLRPGGTAFYVMEGHGMKMYGKAHYLEFKKPERIVYTQQFSDENRNVSRHPMAPTWPETMKTLVQFAAEGQDHTRVTVTWEPHGPVTREELESFVQGRAGMTGGWTGSFDKLETILASTL